MHSKRESYGARGGPGEAENSVGLQAGLANGERGDGGSLAKQTNDHLANVGNGVYVRASTVGEGNGS